MSTSELLDLIKPLILDLIEDADWDIFNDPILYFILFLLLELMKDPTSQLLNQDLFSDVDKGRNLIKNLFLELVGDPGLHFMGTPGSEEIRSQFDHLASGVHLIEDTGLQEILDNFLNRMSGLTLVRDQRLHVIQTLLLYLIRTRLWQLSKGAVMESCRSCINKKPMTSFSPRCPECLFRTLFPVRASTTESVVGISLLQFCIILRHTLSEAYDLIFTVLHELQNSIGSGQVLERFDGNKQ